MSLFTWGRFTSHAGLSLPFKIDCDALTDTDIECFAKIIASSWHFTSVEGIPRGGLRIAKALEPYIQPNPPMQHLIVDDVLTTGTSMAEAYARARKEHTGTIVCVALFSRATKQGPQPKIYVEPVFQLTPYYTDCTECKDVTHNHRVR